MKETKTYCDICGGEIKITGGAGEVMFNISTSFQGSINKKFKEVCYNCVDKINCYVYDLGGKNESN